MSVLIDQKMQLTGCDYGNGMRNVICVERNADLNGPTVHSQYCGSDLNSVLDLSHYAHFVLNNINCKVC